MNDIFHPDYKRVRDAVTNKKTKGFPLYEHNTSIEVMSRILGKDLNALPLKERFSQIAQFHINHGYDTYSFEVCVTILIQQGKGLTGQAGPLIHSVEDLNKYPWHELTDRYFEKFAPFFQVIRETLPEGMKIVGGIGNGVFETIQDFVPYTDLAYLEIDDQPLFETLWEKVGNALYAIWERFLKEYSDILAVARFGDDLGFKSAPLLKPEVIYKNILTIYKKIVALVHSYDIPFLLHSCGCIFSIMDRLIEETGIDGKHSNEDAIAPFSQWVEMYGSKIGNFGGFDMDFICRKSPEEIKTYVRNIVEPLQNERGLAFGTGNQIADYVPPENFQAMVSELRSIRGF